MVEKLFWINFVCFSCASRPQTLHKRQYKKVKDKTLDNMKKMKKKARYICPRIIGASALLQDLICESVRFNIQVKELENINADTSDEVFYFES